MFTVASDLQRKETFLTENGGLKPNPIDSLPQPLNSRLPSSLPSNNHLPNPTGLGRYSFHGEEGRICSCVDTLTGERLSVQVYKKKEFVQLASILLTSCTGVNSPLHVISTDDEVVTVCKRTYGDLHDFLRSKKRLTEAQAAPLFRQIVDLVKHAHRQGIVLRDLKLKKFMFVDSER